MIKHAYLIMAHSNWDVLSKLLKCLDDERNDIYLHIDKKAVFDTSRIYTPQKAKYIMIPRLSINWGGFSMIEVELALIEAAVRGDKYAYYHLLSGQDLPLKDQNYIHGFFERNQGKNYIRFDPNAEKNRAFEKRVKEYHFLQEVIGRNKGLLFEFLRYVEKASILVQQVLHVDRLARFPYKMYKGTNWFSITHEMAQYVISNKSFIVKWFRHTLCADELFLQTLAMVSPFKDSLVDDSLREIDWKRGTPYTYRNDDYDMLIQSNNLYARKFSSDVDSVIIERLFDRLQH